MPQCPICSQYIYVKADASKDAIVNHHILSGCTLHLISTQQKAQESHLSAATKCAQPTGCRNEEKLSTLICAKCGGQFCLAHRLPITHRCAGIATEAKASADASAATDEKHSKGKALLASLKAKREAKKAAQAQHDAAHAAAYPVNGAAASSTSASAFRPTPNKPAGFVTLQQIRAGINRGAAAAMSAINNAISPALSPQPTGAAASSLAPTSAHASAATAAAAAAASSAGPPVTPASPAPSLTASDRARALGDESIPENMRIYLRVDVRAIKPKRAPVLCFFASKHTIGKTLDVICDVAGIENENHLPQGKRLYLCAPRLGATFPPDLALHLLEGQILPGETITLQRQPILAT